jgi:alpha-mannosidase
VSGTGWCIIDANLVAGETLVRNFVLGQAWLQRILGLRPRLANRSDAFGNSAQLPQILRACGFVGVIGLSYSPCHAAWWRGLDGSSIAVIQPPTAAYGGAWSKLRPCPRCAGVGCATCAGRGIDHANAAASLPGVPNAGIRERHPQAMVRVTPEEQLPNPAIVSWAAEHGARFACEEEMLDTHPGGEAPPGGDLPAELNPNNSGCWTTRVRLKQRLRDGEDAVRAAETWSTLAGRSEPGLEELWQDLCFTAFHDAVTGTLVDPAAIELEEVHDRIAAGASVIVRRSLAGQACAGVSVLNHLGSTANCLVDLPSGMAAAADDDGRILPAIPNGGGMQTLVRVPPLSGIQLHPAPDVPVLRDQHRDGIASDRFRIEADAAGIVAIRDLRLGGAISVRRHGIAPAGLLVEHDHGSPWATLSPPGPAVALHLVPVGSEAGNGWQRLRLATRPTWGRCAGASADMGHVEATVELLVIDGHDRIEITTTVDWDTHDLRLRLAFPLPFDGVAWYGVPYGMLARPSYQPTWSWAGADGDWPCHGWAGVQGRERAVALLERGTPAIRHHDGLLSTTLLRAPTQPTYLHEPVSYRMTAWDGMRDAGRHVLRHALVAYDRPFADSTVVADAEAFAAAPTVLPGRIAVPSAPLIEGAGVRLGAVWRSPDDGVALRLIETRGRSAEAHITVPWNCSAARRCGPEAGEGTPLALHAGSCALALRPWEIATVVVAAS